MKTIRFLLVYGVCLCLVLVVHSSTAQVISTFNFTSTATILQATTGPDALSVNPLAFVSGNRAKMPATSSGAGIGLDLVLPGAIFDVDHIDISVNYEGSAGEGAGNFFKRGNHTYFGWLANRLIARYRTSDGAGGYLDYTLNTTFVLDNTNARDYRFTYDDVTGVATIYADGVSVATFDGPDSRPLYWTGSGNAVIGDNIDNNNNASADKGIGSISVSGGNTPLPISFVSINAERNNNKTSTLSWSAAEKDEMGFYNIQKSIDGQHFETIYAQIPLQGGDGVHQYTVAFDEPTEGITYYRVVYIDNQNTETYSPITTCEPFSGEINIFYNGEKIVLLNPIGAYIKTIQVCDVTGKSPSSQIEINSVEDHIEINTTLQCTNLVTVVTNTEVITTKVLVY